MVDFQSDPVCETFDAMLDGSPMDTGNEKTGDDVRQANGGVASTGENYVVISRLDDSMSTLAAEAALIDRWFGIDILILLGDCF